MDQELIPHLFRKEFRKITAVLSRRFGLEHVEAAEDIAGETFLAAMEVWPYKGIPQNPSAWLYAVAKNKAINYATRERRATQKAAQVSLSAHQISEADWKEETIADSQLQMIFALCHPSIPTEAQIGLALRILCGFGIDEIANAFLTNRETINKRLFRARAKLRKERIKIEPVAAAEMPARLDAVMTTLYLLFNEGYHSESEDTGLRKDLCFEAMRLTRILTENKQTNQPPVNALLALMCFHASRFDARTGKEGEMILYDDQDASLWDRRLIAKGAYYLHKAAAGDRASKYHIEAAIAYWHTIREDTAEKWEKILQLHDQLLIVAYSPVAALNRAYALAKVKGCAAAIPEAEKLNLSNNHYYFALLGELYREIDANKARINLQKARALAKTLADKKTIDDKIAALP